MSEGLRLISTVMLFSQHYPTSFVSSSLVVSDEGPKKIRKKKKEKKKLA